MKTFKMLVLKYLLCLTSCLTGITSNPENSFKCTTDGLSEDENDCRMYFECLWMGTPFEKQEHHKCSDALIYNPRKHRCDNISEFEIQFANGVQTSEDLLEFMRFRSCLSMISNTNLNTTPSIESNVEFTTSLPTIRMFETDSLLNDYPQTRAYSRISSSVKKEIPVSESSTTTKLPLITQTAFQSDTNATQNADPMFLMEDERVYFGKKVYYDTDSKYLNDTKNIKFQKTRKFNETNAENSIRIVGTEKKRGFIHTFNNNNKPKMQNSNKPIRARAGVFHTTRIFKIFLNDKKKKSQLDTNLDLASELIDKNKTSLSLMETEEENAFFNKSKPINYSKEARHKSHVVFSNKTNSASFKSRKLLSISNEESDYFTQYDDSLISTTEDDEEIESTDPAYQDKDEQINELTDRLIGKPKNMLANNITSNIIDTIEARLTKRGKTNVEKKVTFDENQTEKIILHTEYDKATSSSSVEPTQKASTSTSTSTSSITSTPSLVPETTSIFYRTPMRVGSIFKKTLKFIKALPKLENYSNLIKDSRINHLDQMLFSGDFSLKNRSLNSFPTTKADFVRFEHDEDDISSHDLIFKSSSTVPSSSFSSFSQETSSSIPSTTQTKALPTTIITTTPYQPIPSTAFIPSYRHSKPFMQTYRINQTKKLPNQFASLRLNYDQTAATKIDEIEKGGKFQRLRVVPADTLIECKENDFGMECSCSITLSPPKCKQLINSFLSSCRILGCKNNGRCINMAYKYPIPYVCSCPSTHMGTYCEIKRELIEEDFNKERKVQLWRNANIDAKLTKNNITDIPFKNTVLLSKSSITLKNPFISLTTKSIQTNSRPIQSKKIENKEETLCQPNPCMNEAKCEVERISSTFQCICLNESFSGKYCEVFKMHFQNSIQLLSETTHLKPLLNSTTVSSTTSSAVTEKSKLTDNQEPIPYYTRAFFWQCPSNCLFNLGRGFCKLSKSGYPKCSCHEKWTGVDCGQKNYCFNNGCQNNSTCSNYPEMRSYLCICKKNYSGRQCEIEVKSTTQIQHEKPTLPNQIPQRIYKMETKPINLTKSLEKISSPIYKSTTTISENSQMQNEELTQKVKHLTTTIPLTSPRPKNPCLTEKCQNNGTCVMSFSHAKNRFSFICKCSEGFHGVLCEKVENACEPNPCQAPFKQCISLGYKKYECVCAHGSDCEQKLTTGTTSFVTSSTQTSAEIQKLTYVSSFSTSRPLAKVKHTTQTVPLMPTTPRLKYPLSSVLSQEKEDASLDAKNVFSKKKMIHFLRKKLKQQANNVCNSDKDLCLNYPYGNDSFICIKSYLTQEYSVCLPTKSVSCKENNPCLNGGLCIDNLNANLGEQNWKCECSKEFTGKLCETELCSSVHRLFSNHTMCLPDSMNLVVGGMDTQDIDLIIDMHNTLRRQVAPLASNMQKMYWDIRLQHLAQKRAQLCSVENTGILMRQQPGYGIVIGENLAAGYEKWAHVLSSWMSESRHFIYKSTSANDNLLAGHYTQMIYSSASRIGCGFAQCSNTTYDRYFVCYYGEMQTYYSRYEPYLDGPTCSKCKNNCDNGLCDCKGAFCSNGGTMDLRTCTCTCPYSTFTGRYCENVICPKEDSPFCSTTLFEDKCWLYPVVRATCPYMCSLCSNKNQHGNSTLPIFKSNGMETTPAITTTMQEIIDLISN